jgi:hypothetical protein
MMMEFSGFDKLPTNYATGTDEVIGFVGRLLALRAALDPASFIGVLAGFESAAEPARSIGAMAGFVGSAGSDCRAKRTCCETVSRFTSSSAANSASIKRLHRFR